MEYIETISGSLESLSIIKQNEDLCNIDIGKCYIKIEI